MRNYVWLDGIQNGWDFKLFVDHLQQEYRGDLSKFGITSENINDLRHNYITGKQTTILETIDWGRPNVDVLINDLFSMGGKIVSSLPFWIYFRLLPVGENSVLQVILKYTTIDYCAKPGDTALHFAIKYAYKKSAEVLLNNGAKLYKTCIPYRDLPSTLRQLVEEHRVILRQCVAILSSKRGCKDVLRMIAKTVYYRSLSKPVSL
jgi:ankyrin repeat protein